MGWFLGLLYLMDSAVVELSGTITGMIPQRRERGAVALDEIRRMDF